MAISKVIFASMIASGRVKSIRNRSGESNNGPWAVRTVTLEQASGAQCDIDCWGDNGKFEIGEPLVGDYFVANVYVNEAGREPGLRFHSWAFDELDRIHSALSSKKAA